MLSLEKLRKLDPSLNDMPDEQLEVIRASYYEIAEVAFDAWYEEHGSKNPAGLSPTSIGSSKL